MRILADGAADIPQELIDNFILSNNDFSDFGADLPVGFIERFNSGEVGLRLRSGHSFLLVL